MQPIMMGCPKLSLCEQFLLSDPVIEKVQLSCLGHLLEVHTRQEQTMLAHIFLSWLLCDTTTCLLPNESQLYSVLWRGTGHRGHQGTWHKGKLQDALWIPATLNCQSVLLSYVPGAVSSLCDLHSGRGSQVWEMRANPAYPLGARRAMLLVSVIRFLLIPDLIKCGLGQMFLPLWALVFCI